jgi:hypothetical protein
MTMSLVKLAERRLLPEFQYMDQQTLDWICSNRPSISRLEYEKKFFSYPFTRVGSPLVDEWFLEPKIIDGIHGTRHALRVSIYAYALARRLGFSGATCDAVALAGLLHDVRRVDDKSDFEHGSRCAEWLKNYSPFINLAKPFTDAQRTAIGIAISFHEQAYDKISRMAEYVSAKNEVDILKTADALDRYRLPKIKWWIDEAFLQIKPPDEFRAFSFDLVVISEQRFLDGNDNATAVIIAVDQLIS